MYFFKMPFLTKNVNFLKNCWSDRSENLQVGAQDDFEKMKFEKGGVHGKFDLFEKMKKIPVPPPPPPYNAQQSIYGNKKS